jgi:hypothetical protein
MFDILNSVPMGDAVLAVHEATLRLHQRERLEGLKGSNLPLTENALAAQLLAEIAEVEGRHPADLSREELSRYIVKVSDTLERRMQAERPPNPARGEEILKEMRAAYSWPHYGRRVAG